MKRFLNRILIFIVIISLVISISCIVVGVQRRDWIITTAEITFVAYPDGIVCGTFKDIYGIIHTDEPLYKSNGFTSTNIIRGNPAGDSEQFYGTTIRIIYDPKSINIEDRGLGVIDNYNHWFYTIIISNMCFVLSLSVIMFYKIKSRKHSND